MGDFRARINLGNNDFDNYVFFDSNLNHMRQNLDTKYNCDRGNRLITMLDDKGYVVLNGRSISDFSGFYTYISANGNITIDLAWINPCSIQNIVDFIVNNFAAYSDQKLCTIKISDLIDPIKSNTQKNSFVQKTVWKQENINIFNDSILRIANIYTDRNSHLIYYQLTYS